MRRTTAITSKLWHIYAIYKSGGPLRQNHPFIIALCWFAGLSFVIYSEVRSFGFAGALRVSVCLHLHLHFAFLLRVLRSVFASSSSDFSGLRIIQRRVLGCTEIISLSSSFWLKLLALGELRLWELCSAEEAVDQSSVLIGRPPFRCVSRKVCEGGNLSAFCIGSALFRLRRFSHYPLFSRFRARYSSCILKSMQHTMGRKGRLHGRKLFFDSDSNAEVEEHKEKKISKKLRKVRTRTRFLKPGALSQLRDAKISSRVSTPASSSKSCTAIGRKRVLVTDNDVDCGLRMSPELSLKKFLTHRPFDTPKFSPFRKLIESDVATIEDPSTPCTPLPQEVKADTVPHPALPDTNGECYIEKLPLDCMVRILCFLDHDQLENVAQLSSKMLIATQIAKQCHFNYKTPNRSGRNLFRFNSRGEPQWPLIPGGRLGQCPSTPKAPKPGLKGKSRLSNGEVREVAVVLFPHPSRQAPDRNPPALPLEGASEAHDRNQPALPSLEGASNSVTRQASHRLLLNGFEDEVSEPGLTRQAPHRVLLNEFEDELCKAVAHNRLL